MSKKLKNYVANDLDRRFRSIGSYIVVDHRGLNSAQSYDLRKILHEAGIRMTVVPNRLALRTLDRWNGQRPKIREIFRGPSAIISAEKDGAIHASRAVMQWKKKNKDILQIKGGVLEDEILTPAMVEGLSKIPDRKQLLAMVAGGMQAPLRRLAVATRSIIGRVAIALEAYRKKLADSQAPGSGTGEGPPSS